MAEPARKFTDADADAGVVPHARHVRRPVTLAAYGTRGDGSLVEMTVVDLSYDGCGVICTVELRPGERIDLSVVRRGRLTAEVRWVDGAKAGLAFPAEPAEKSETRQPRRHERVSVEGEVTMRRVGKHNFRVHVYDLSPDGCKAEFIDRPELGEQLWIKFDGIEALEAQVCWIVGAKTGLKFVCPIYAAVFEMLLVRLGGRPAS